MAIAHATENGRKQQALLGTCATCGTVFDAEAKITAWCSDCGQALCDDCRLVCGHPECRRLVCRQHRYWAEEDRTYYCLHHYNLYSCREMDRWKLWTSCVLAAFLAGFIIAKRK